MNFRVHVTSNKWRKWHPLFQSPLSCDIMTSRSCDSWRHSCQDLARFFGRNFNSENWLSASIMLQRTELTNGLAIFRLKRKAQDTIRALLPVDLLLVWITANKYSPTAKQHCYKITQYFQSPWVIFTDISVNLTVSKKSCYTSLL